MLQFSSVRRSTERSIPAAQADAVRAQTEQYGRLRRLYRELIEGSERPCKARLSAAAAGKEPDGTTLGTLHQGVRRGG